MNYLKKCPDLNARTMQKFLSTPSNFQRSPQITEHTRHSTMSKVRLCQARSSKLVEQKNAILLKSCTVTFPSPIQCCQYDNTQYTTLDQCNADYTTSVGAYHLMTMRQTRAFFSSFFFVCLSIHTATLFSTNLIPGSRLAQIIKSVVSQQHREMCFKLHTANFKTSGHEANTV